MNALIARANFTGLKMDRTNVCVMPNILMMEYPKTVKNVILLVRHALEY